MILAKEVSLSNDLIDLLNRKGWMGAIFVDDIVRYSGTVFYSNNYGWVWANKDMAVANDPNLEKILKKTNSEDKFKSGEVFFMEVPPYCLYSDIKFWSENELPKRELNEDAKKAGKKFKELISRKLQEKPEYGLSLYYDLDSALAHRPIRINDCYALFSNNSQANYNGILIDRCDLNYIRRLDEHPEFYYSPQSFMVHFVSVRKDIKGLVVPRRHIQFSMGEGLADNY